MPLAESKVAIRLMKTYVFPVIGELDQSEVSMDALRRLHLYAAYRSRTEARAALDLMVEILWELGNKDEQI